MDLTQIIAAFKKHKIGFIGFTYENKQGEIAKIVINLGFTYENIKKKDLKKLNEGVEFIAGEGYAKDSWNEAITDLKVSVDDKAEKSEEAQNRSAGAIENVIYFTDNKTLKYNTNTGRLFIIGLLNSKVVLKDGKYPKVKSSPKTLAKKKILKHYLSIGDMRNYAMDKLIGNIKMNGDILEIE